MSTGFPVLDRIFEEDDAWRDIVEDSTITAELASHELKEAGHPVSPSTIRTYRRSRKPKLAPTVRGVLQDDAGLNAVKILTVDIETIPAMGWFYDLKTSWIPHSHVTEPGDMLCWAAKWYHQPNESIFAGRNKGYDEMLVKLWTLLDEADYAVGWNSDKFDLQRIRGYFARNGLPPFAPPKSIDLMRTAKTFAYESASLDYTARQFGVTRKVANGGAGNWIGCMAGDPVAWALMEEYNRGDVQTTEELFDAMRPWIKGHPNIHPEPGFCPRCASADLTYVGEFQPEAYKYALYRCDNCQGLSRETARTRASILRAV